MRRWHHAELAVLQEFVFIVNTAVSAVQDYSYPSLLLPLMPKNPDDMVKRVRDVPKEDLR